ncbi:MAG: Ig-like domain-containing protein [Cytophagales bacterium]
MKNIIYKIFLFIGIAINSIFAQDLCKVVGWASQNGGVTGGGSATSQTVTTYSALAAACSSSTVKVIYVSGAITLPTNGRIGISNQSGKTIIGLAGSSITSVDMTASGSGIFYIKGCTNFIIRNLTLIGPGAYDVDGNDNMTLDNCQNFWIDHCEFHDGMDGNFDIKNMSDYITVTWCTFSYEKAPKAGGSGGTDDHRFSDLFGSSDSATGDDGKLRITMQYNWWGQGCVERMPRVRFGKVHLVNNLYTSTVSSSCIRAGYKADLLIESNVFIGVKKPIDLYNGDYTAVTAKNNLFTSTSGNTASGTGTAFTPPYSLTIGAASTVEAVVKKCAGATLVNPSPSACSACSTSTTTTNVAPTVSITSPTASASFTAPATVTITANAADSDGTIASVAFYNGSTLLGTDASSPYSYSWTNVAAGTYTIKAIATDNSGATTTSATVTFTVIAATTNKAPTVSITSPTASTSFTAPATVAITANAADSDGSIASVAFYNGSTLLATVTTSPYSYSWTNVAAGTYSLTAVAKDNSGATTTSSSVSITVTSGTSTTAATLTKKGTGSSTQTVSLGSEIVSFYYLWTDATGATATGLPTGVTATVDAAASTITFSGAPTVTGTFNFTVTTTGSTTNASKTGTITVSAVTDVVDANVATGFHVYPNPTSHAVTIENENFAGTMKVYDVYGNLIQQLQFSGTAQIGAEYPKGMYIVHLENQGKLQHLKFAKE